MEFKNRTLGRTGLNVSPFGIGGGYGIRGNVLERAFDSGINTFFYAPIFPTYTPMMLWLRSKFPANREKINLFTATYFWRFPFSIERTIKRHLSWLRTDYLDAFFLGMTGSLSQDSAFESLLKLKDNKIIRFIGVSIHKRKLVPELIKKYPVDIIMVRYNIAHRGAEKEVFPFVKDQGVIAFNSLKHGKILKKNNDWDEKNGKFPTAEEAYRFVLSNEHVDMCLAGPRNIFNIETIKNAIQAGPLEQRRIAELCAYGDFLHKT
jgi:aryl-alcohol dehydrogenase-like predicted oxidoreductase